MTTYYIDRETQQKEREDVYGEKLLQLLYGEGRGSQLWRAPLRAIAKIPMISHIFGWWQKMPFTQKKVAPFIKKYNIDSSEFAVPVEKFDSFNDFFIRRLKPHARPIDPNPNKTVLPADGRYQFIEDLSKKSNIEVKNLPYSLSELLDDKMLAEKYKDGSMVIARLCPTDYHRFHFPCSGVPGRTRLIKGWLSSVNPLALAKKPRTFIENKRTITSFKTDNFGEILYLEVGATNVGSIVQTFVPGEAVDKGHEKGYFQFGGSTLILLFPPRRIIFDQDLLRATSQGLEVKSAMGQSMGKALGK
ncbi:MAG: phosphatidylserine decarboxylase [Chlamydiota bacterium]